MAASDPNQHSHPPPAGGGDPTAVAAVYERVREEVARAERHGTQLSCLLVVFDDLDEMARDYGGELREQTLDYVVHALSRQLRCFDRVARTEEGDMIVLLPGADSPRGEIVARRALERLRTIKVEAAGRRMPLQVSVGLAAWREALSGQALVAQARAALRGTGGEPRPPSGPGGGAPTPGRGMRAPGPLERLSSSAALGRVGAQ